MFLSKRRLLNTKVSRQMEKRAALLAKKMQKHGFKAVPSTPIQEIKIEQVEVEVETTTTTAKPKKIKKDNE